MSRCRECRFRSTCRTDAKILMINRSCRHFCDVPAVVNRALLTSSDGMRTWEGTGESSIDCRTCAHYPAIEGCAWANYSRIEDPCPEFMPR